MTAITLPNKSTGDDIDTDHLLRFIDFDATADTSSNTTSEITQRTTTIAANSVITGILVLANVRFGGRDAGGDNNTQCTFRLKIDGTLRQTIILWAGDPNGIVKNDGGGGLLMYWDTAPTWSGSVDVVLTSQMSQADANLTAYYDGMFIQAL